MRKYFILQIIFICSCFILSSCTSKTEIDEVVESPIFATWINYNEINNLVTSSNTDDEFERKIDNVISTLNDYGINTVFLQVRAFDDCFYVSSIVPVSQYCSVNDKLKFDVLKTFIDVSDKYDIKIHAWINPYRIRNDDKIEMIKNPFAKEILKNENDERIIITENKIYYNPAYMDIQNYILRCIKEIIENYDVAGIHIDDYFYPTTSNEIDKKIYNDYVENNGQLSLAEFRRNSVNSLVSSIYTMIKKSNENIIFSISPNADININYNNFYADVELWSKSIGYADYIIPQIYFGFQNSNANFVDLLNEWIKMKTDNNKIIIGLALYKSGNEDNYAGKGIKEWCENSNIISNQIKYSLEKGADGVSIYSASYLYSDTRNNNLIEEKNLIKDKIINWNN